jgi:hypothetical protein
VTGLHRRLGPASGRTRPGTADPGRVLRRRRGPLQLALGGVLVVLILVVEVLILQAYVNINRTTAIFGQQSFVTGALVNVQRETLLLNVKIEELPTSRDLRGTQVRRALLANQLNQLRGLGGGDTMVDDTIRGVDQDLGVIDQALARVEAAPTEARLRAETDRMRPAIRRAIVRLKQLYDAKEQGFFGALSTALNTRRSSERLLVGLSGLVLIVGWPWPSPCASGSARTSPGPTRRSPPRSRSARRPSGRCGPARSGSGRWSRTPPT